MPATIQLPVTNIQKKLFCMLKAVIQLQSYYQPGTNSYTKNKHWLLMKISRFMFSTQIYVFLHEY